MVLGHFFPMHAATIPEKDTLGNKIARRFRRPITTAEYGRLNAVIAHIRAARHSWSVLAYNCNDFVADVARAVGMQTPTTLSLPYDFIPALQAINASRRRQISAPPPARVAEVRPSAEPYVDWTNKPDRHDGCEIGLGGFLTFTPPRQAGRK